MIWPPSITLQGKHVAVVPLGVEHHDALVDVVRDGEMWKYWYTKIPSPEAMQADIERRLGLRERGSMQPFVIVGKARNKVVGATSYMNIDADNRRVEIGSTWYARRVQRSPLNTECKLMLLSHAFETLPQSSEQILHPPKYFIHEAPVKVSLPDVHLTLGRVWRRIESDVNGEWSFYLILDEFLKSASTSKQAAAGWAGDRYATYENSSGQAAYVSLSAWDTTKDAREFFDAYVKRTKLRYADARVLSERATAWSAQTSEGAVTIELRGNRVLVLEGIPATVNSRGVIRLLWRSS